MMFRKLWLAIRPALLWSYRRGSWQYDVVVVAILAFIFLPPRDVFDDQPRPPTVREIPALALGEDVRIFWVDSRVVDEEPKDEAESRLRALLKQRTGQDFQVVDTRPAPVSDGEDEAYLVYARP